MFEVRIWYLCRLASTCRCIFAGSFWFCCTLQDKQARIGPGAVCLLYCHEENTSEKNGVFLPNMRISAENHSSKLLTVNNLSVMMASKTDASFDARRRMYSRQSTK